MKQSITVLELAYLAGVFDGEGSISISRNKHGWKLECSVQVAGSYIPLLFQFNFGGSLRKRPISNAQPQWHEYHRWQVSSRQAAQFLKALTPYLRLKKAQAELGIRFQERLSRNLYRGRTKLSDEELALREAESLLMQQLKRESYVN